MNLERHTGYLCDRQATQKDSFLIHAGPFPQSYFFAKTPYEVEFLRKVSDHSEDRKRPCCNSHSTDLLKEMRVP